MDKLSEKELLSFLKADGRMYLSEIESVIQMKRRQEYLQKHENAIWEGKDGKWRTYINVDDSRKMIKRSTKKDVEDAVVAYYIGLDESMTNPTVREICWRWINEREEFGEVENNTLTRYRTDINRFLPPKGYFSEMRIRDITEGELERFIKKTIRDKGLNSKSYAGLRLILKGTFKYAKSFDYTDISISTFFADLNLSRSIFKQQSTKHEYIYNTDEIQMLLNYYDNHPSMLNYALAFQTLTGLRVGELVTIKWEDHYKKYHLKVERCEQVYKKDGKTFNTVKDSPKQGKKREIIITDSAELIIKKAKLMNNSNEWMFNHENGERFTTRQMRLGLIRACDELKIDYRPTHQVRKTYASNLLANNVDVATVKAQMGHSDISTTQNYYHFDIMPEEKVIQKLNMIVG